MTLVVDKQYYPSSGNYFVSPWPVSFQIANLPDNSKKKYRIVYLGSALAWHDFEYMVRIVNTLGDQWKIDVYAPEESRDIVEKYSKKLCFCGFVSNDNISKELSKYKFGFALYAHNYGSKRNKVGSPMKVIHYLINDVIPIVNIVSDKNLKNKFPNIIDTSNMDVTDIVKEINLLRSNHEETSEHNKQYLVDMYSPENYYKKVLGILFKMNNV